MSPQNILVGMDGRARITDFGVARAVMRITKTRTGEVKGKVRYFSPEQAIGGEADRRSDVFSLGIVAWELLTGLQLFRGRSLLDVHQAVLTQEIDPPTMHRPELPAAIGAAILRALAREPDDRYATADLFARELRKAAAASDVDLATTSQIVHFVEERAATTVDRLTRSIRESVTPSGVGLGDAAEEDPTTLDPLTRGARMPAISANPDGSPSGRPTAIERLRSTQNGPGRWRRWWNAFLKWLGLR